MHLSLNRRSTKRASSPPQKAAPSAPETSGTSGTDESLPHESNATPSPQASPHGIRAIGRRMTSFSKPVRMLKTIASRSNLNGHGRRASSMSVNSTESQQEAAEHEHEPGVKEERESVDTDYGKVVTKLSNTESVPAGEQEKGADGEQKGISREGAHEAEARQEPVAEVALPKKSETRVEQVANANALEQPATPVVKAAVEAVATDAKDIEQVAIGAEARNPKEATPEKHPVPLTAVSDSVVFVPSQNAETISLSSSSTTVDPPIQTTTNTIINGNADASKKVKQVVMQQGEDLAKSKGADVNPFLVDDPEDSLSEPETGKKAASSPAAKSDAGTPVVQSVVLESTSSAAPPPAPAVVDEEQSAPPPPPEKPSESLTSPISPSIEDEAPELHTPALTVTSLFLPVPQTDPLSALLTKHIPEPHLRPPRDTSGEWQHTDFHTLVMTNNWRALARMARDRIVSASPRDVELILNLWYIRLSSLARLRLFNQTSAECENLFSVLATIEPPTTRAYILRSVLPFELEVLRARCAYWSGDHLGYLDDVSALLRRCRVRARQAQDSAELAMWKERGARMALIVASQLVEMKDYTAAATLLEPLCSSGASPPSPALLSAIARIYLQGGDLSAAATHFDAVDADPNAETALKAMNAVVHAAASGDWVTAADYAKSLAQREPEDVVAANNYAVALLGQGRIKEGIQILEAALQASPSATTATEPYLFNLSTMYELRAGLAAHRKRDLLIEVAKWSGDGLRTTCLKMNA